MDIIENQVAPVLYCIIAVIGIAGNGLVITSILLSKDRFKSPTEVYVFNLAVADLLFVTTLPFWANDLFVLEWNFGKAGCKILSAISYLNMYGSIFFLTTMGIDRRQAVVQAVATRESRTARNAWRNSAIVWGVSVPFAVFPAAYRNSKDFGSGEVCTWDFPIDYYVPLNLAYSISRTLIGFIIPLVIISLCYSNILIFMKKRNKIFHKSFKELTRITRLVSVIILCFVITWLPNQITNVMQFCYLAWKISPCSLYASVPINASFDYNETEQLRSSNPGNFTTPPNYRVDLNTVIASTTVSQLHQHDSTPMEYYPDEYCIRIIRQIHMITVCLGFSNSMMNPFIYASILKKNFTRSLSFTKTLGIRGTTSTTRQATTSTVAKYRSATFSSDSNGKVASNHGVDCKSEQPERELSSPSRSRSGDEDQKTTLLSDTGSKDKQEDIDVECQNLSTDIWMGPTDR